MISEIDLQMLRDLSRDAAAFEQLRALVERLMTAPGTRASQPSIQQTDAAFLAALVQSSQDAIFTKTVDGIITSWNPAAEKLLGYSAAEIMGQSIKQILPPDEYAAVARMDQRVAAGERIASFETVRRHKDGHAVDVSLTFSPIRAADGKILGISVIAHDITEKKQMRAALEASAQQLHSVFNTVQDAIFSVELPSSRLTYINPAGERLMGRTLQEFQADFEQRLALVHPDDLESARALHTRLLAEGTAESEYRILQSNGAIRWVNFRAWLNRDADGRPMRYDVIGRDVTEIREVRAALETSERRLRSLFDTLEDAIFSVELPSGRMTYVNPAGERQMGRTLQEFQENFELRLTMAYPDDLPIIRAGQARMLSEGTVEMEYRLVRPDGTIRWINTRAWLIRDAAQQPIRYEAISRDITTLKEAEAVRQHMLDQEKELINLKARFISLASHEFRTPLAAILATTESLLLYRQRMTDEKITERLERIRQQVGYLHAIMEDVLLLSRFQAGGVEFRPVKGDLVALCHELIDEFESQTAYTGRIHCDCPVPTMSMQFDPRLLRQAISNLLTNALKYSAAPQPVEMRVRYDDDQITVVVQDQGIGIPPDDLKRLFEPFHRAGNVGSIGGTGLGMSIAKQAVEAHGGTIAVTSAVGCGTTFTVSLPRQR
ncbi:MAG: PAS domain S-box protein [Anaerolineae bacterium]|nr:PAS domain S-box protein [Anaerolineae bacterium]